MIELIFSLIAALLCIASYDGSCVDLSRFARPELADLPAVMTFYDPARCLKPDATERDLINCDSDPTRTADGSIVSEDLYGVAAACDRSLLGSRVEIIGLGIFECRDTGGMIKPTWSPHYGRWVIYFDVLLHEAPSWNYMLFDEWRVVGE